MSLPSTVYLAIPSRANQIDVKKILRRFNSTWRDDERMIGQNGFAVVILAVVLARNLGRQHSTSVCPTESTATAPYFGRVLLFIRLG